MEKLKNDTDDYKGQKALQETESKLTINIDNDRDSTRNIHADLQ